MAVRFGGTTSDYLSMSNRQRWQTALIGSRALTVATWVNAESVDATTTNNNDTILGGTCNTGSNGLTFKLSSTRQVGIGGRIQTGGSFYTPVHSDGIIELNSWYHIAAVWNLTDKYVQFFINGRMDSSFGLSTTENFVQVAATSGNDRIGGRFTGGTAPDFFHGALAHTAIWGDDIGSKAISDIAGGLRPDHCDCDCLRFYYPFIDTPWRSTQLEQTGTVNGSVTRVADPNVAQRLSRISLYVLPAGAGDGNASYDGVTLTVTSGSFSATGGGEASFNSGTMTATAGDFSATGGAGAGFDGVSLNITSAGFSATGGGEASYSGQTLTITAGAFTASGSSGDGSASYDGATITITSGSYSATGEASASFSGGTLTITAGGYSATGGGSAAFTPPTLTITAGSFSAIGAASANYSGGTLTISSGSFTAMSFIVPTYHKIAPASTLKITHFRRLREYRDPIQAERIHNQIKGSI